MKKAAEYRQHAEECRLLARRANGNSERKQLLTMADTWENLAIERQLLMARHPELFENANKTVSETTKSVPADA
jgi:hypothetical protein